MKLDACRESQLGEFANQDLDRTDGAGSSYTCTFLIAVLLFPRVGGYEDEIMNNVQGFLAFVPEAHGSERSEFTCCYPR
jgi:hypothetical protein